jgi:outer membrane protein
MKPSTFLLLSLFSSQIGFAYHLDECLEIARSNSHRIEMARCEIDAAKASQSETFSGLLPRIQLEGRYELKNSQRDYSVFTDFGSAFSSKTVGVTANLLLFDFFSTWNFYKAGRFNVESAKNNMEMTRQMLDEEVKACYFRYLEIEKANLVIEESIRSLEQQRQTTGDYFEQGIVSKTDLLSVEVQLAEKKKNRLRARHEQIETRMAMNRLLGRDLLDPLTLEEVPMTEYEIKSVESLQEMALRQRSDRIAMLSQIQALEARYQAAKAMHAPKFYLYGGYNFLESAPAQGHKMNTPDKNWLSGGLGLQFPLFEGGKTSAGVHKALAQLSQAKAQLEEFDTALIMEVEKSYLSLQEQFANISIEKTAIELAEENLRSTKDRYSQGLVSINDYLEANEQLAQSKLGLNRAIYRYHGAYAHLLTAVGEQK